MALHPVSHTTVPFRGSPFPVQGHQSTTPSTRNVLSRVAMVAAAVLLAPAKAFSNGSLSRMQQSLASYEEAHAAYYQSAEMHCNATKAFARQPTLEERSFCEGGYLPHLIPVASWDLEVGRCEHSGNNTPLDDQRSLLCHNTLMEESLQQATDAAQTHLEDLYEVCGLDCEDDSDDYCDGDGCDRIQVGGIGITFLGSTEIKGSRGTFL